VSITSDIPAERLAQHLRALREQGFDGQRVKQTDFGKALGNPEPLAASTISNWENAASGKIVPAARVSAYARFYATRKSIEGHEPRLVPDEELDEVELARLAELERELRTLRDAAVRGYSRPPIERGWHYPDEADITIVGSELPREDKAAIPYADPAHKNHVRAYDFGDLDALFDLTSELSAANPHANIERRPASSIDPPELEGQHVVCVGGVALNTVTRWAHEVTEIPIRQHPGEEGLDYFTYEHEGGEHEKVAPRTPKKGPPVEDVAFFARFWEPDAGMRSLTICSGVFTYGVRAAALLLTDPVNKSYIDERFGNQPSYGLLVRVRILNQGIIRPYLPRDVRREWDAGMGKAAHAVPAAA
jgi:hypothetical protein